MAKSITSIPVLSALLDTPQLDDKVSHFTRVIASAGGIDSTLMMVGYTLSFTSAQLRKILESNMQHLAEKVAETASKAIQPGETIVATVPVSSAATRIADAASGMKIFAGMCSDVRMFLRLFGLFKMWVAVKGILRSPPADAVIRVLSYIKLATASVYYFYENQYYLASKGVLKGFKPADMARSFKICIWIYGIYLAADYGSMYRVSQLEQRSGVNKQMTKEEKIAKDAVWWRTFWIDAVYTPLTFHWGIDGGVFNDSTVGLLGAWGGYTGFREAWRLTK